MAVRTTEWEGVYADGPWLLTKNLVPGVSVYGEGRPVDHGVEYRRWDANRSKLAAYLRCGGRVWPFREDTTVLYLGAGSGTTVSHLSDVCSRGTIAAVEISPRSFRDLLRIAEGRPNVIPILGDATEPDAYGSRVGPAAVLYQDIAQRGQIGIFNKNLPLLQHDGIGFLIVKARSEDVAAKPADIFEAAKRGVSDAGLVLLDLRTLAPYQIDHAALVIRRP